MIQQELEKRQAGLILEGGASRGVFTAGALDFLMDHDFMFPYVVGVSAGACNAVSYASKQRGRSFNCLAPEDEENYYIYSGLDIIKNKCMYDMDKLFEKFPYEIYPYDFKKYLELGIDCELVATNVLTGEAEYFKETDSEVRLCNICRASSSLPLVAPMVSLNGVPYLDGGLADSIPLRRAFETGHKKNVVILTRPFGYRKKFPDERMRIYIPFFNKYPNIMKDIYYRPFYYNKRMETIERLEREGKIFVLRPSIPSPTKTQISREQLQGFYDHGYEIMSKEFQAMKEFLAI